MIHGEFVAGRNLPGEPDHLVLDPLFLPALRSILELRVRHEVVRRNPPPGREEPQLVLLDRPAEADVEVGDQVHAVAVDESARAQFVGDVVRLPLPGTAAGEERPAEPVAPLPRNHVDPDAAGRDVGAGAARLIRHFGVRGVAEIRLHFAVVHQAVD